MTTTKQRAFYKWLEECPVEFQYQMEFNSKQENCTDEMYIFRNIPNIELTQPQSKEDSNA